MAQSNSITRPRLQILHVMIIAGVFAIVFAVLNSRVEESFLGIMILLAIAGAWIVVMALRPNPLKALLANLPENTDDKIAALEDGLARRNHYDVRTNALARYRLMEFYKVRKRYQEAIDQGKSILAMKGVNAELEDEVRVEITVCLDFLGRPDEAEMERMAVAGGGEEKPQGFLGWRAVGKALEKQHRYDDAASAYEQALRLTDATNEAGRDGLLVRLVLASFNAGRPEVTVHWAEQAIALEVAETQLYRVHRMAGVACSNLGRLVEATVGLVAPVHLAIRCSARGKREHNPDRQSLFRVDRTT